MASPVPSVSVIVPTFKEAENLPLLIPQVAAALAPRGWAWELIVVDDHSPDPTRRVLDELAARFPQVRYLIRTKDRGLSSAVLAGLELARHDYVVVMDADLSHPPESVPALVEALVKGEGDFVIGSRYVSGGRTEDWSRWRWLNSAGATLLARPLVGTVRDPMAGFLGLRRAALRAADAMNPIGYKIGLELIVKMHVPPERVVEVPITFRNRVHGESKLTLQEQFRYLEHLSRLYDYRFPRGSPRVKFLVAAGSGAAAAYAALAAAMWGLPDFRFKPLAALGVGLLAMIAVTLAFFARYVRRQWDFALLRSPYREFTGISLAEFAAGWGFAAATPANVWWRMAVGLMILLLVRYTLRKVLLHDLRGLRGMPLEKASRRLTLAPGAGEGGAGA